MAKIIIVTPVPGKRVLDPASNPPKPLPEQGKRVLEDSYWIRRRDAGEVTIETVPGNTMQAAPSAEAVKPGKAKG